MSSATRDVPMPPCTHESAVGVPCGGTVLNVRETHAWCASCGHAYPVPSSSTPSEEESPVAEEA